MSFHGSACRDTLRGSDQYTGVGETGAGVGEGTAGPSLL